jgi:chromosome segregation ATPase
MGAKEVRSSMTIAALVIAMVSLGLAALAYWRSGGQRDIERLEAQLRREIDALRAKHNELADHTSQAVAAAYERSRKRLQVARARMHDLQAAAIEGLEVQLRRAGEHLEALGQRLEHSASAAKDATVAAARHAEDAMGRRVRRLHARVVLLEVKGKASLAQRAASSDEFDRADLRLSEASDLLHDVRAILGDDHAYDAQLDAIKARLREAVAAVRQRAEDTRRRIEQVLADADQVVTALESAEGDDVKSEAEPPALSRR